MSLSRQEREENYYQLKIHLQIPDSSQKAFIRLVSHRDDPHALAMNQASVVLLRSLLEEGYAVSKQEVIPPTDQLLPKWRNAVAAGQTTQGFEEWRRSTVGETPEYPRNAAGPCPDCDPDTGCTMNCSPA